MENMVRTRSDTWAGRKVFVTGHTGFKGGWLALWLNRLGAVVHGYALNPPTSPSMFDASEVSSVMASDIRADLADLSRLKEAISETNPEVVFHLAAQALVRESYHDPIATFASNVTGTAHLLEAVRGVSSVRAVVIITTDKVYENREWAYPYREIDALGGHDPYSASKAAAEIVAASYRASFHDRSDAPTHVATARAGNVIGGGDWAADRLVPDCFRAFAYKQAVRLRFPDAVRPWQHVLEPLAGYIQLAELLLSSCGADYARAWNFGPDIHGDATVGQIAQIVADYWGEGAEVELFPSDGNPHEAGLLRLDSSSSRTMLCWKPRWSIPEALKHTVDWHHAWLRGENMTKVSLAQIAAYEALGTE